VPHLDPSYNISVGQVCDTISISGNEGKKNTDILTFLGIMTRQNANETQSSICQNRARSVCYHIHHSTGRAVTLTRYRDSVTEHRKRLQ